MFGEKKQKREWQVGDEVYYYSSHNRGSIPTGVRTVTKVYKTGNFVVEHTNYKGDKYTEQFSAKWSDGYSASATGESWSKSTVRLITPELTARIEEAQAKRRKQKVGEFIATHFSRRGATDEMSADQLARIVSIINETA